MTDETAPQADDFPTGWRPDPGDQVVGTVVDIATGQGDWDPYPIVTLKADDGNEIAVHAFHTVLRRELARRRPKIGNRLDITYVGKKPGKGNTTYELYRVRGEGDTSGYDWSRDDPDATGDPSPASDITPDVPAAEEPVTVPADDDADLPF